MFSANNCLRYDDNVLEISGLEGEHDKGTLSFADAVAALRKAGIRCIVYTSPSYVPGTKERWRVLVVLSQFHAPSFRVGLMARLNGILGGALAGESFTLSQPFYYGSVDNNPNHKVELIDGDFIDLRDDLVASAIFKDGSRAGDATPGSHAKSQATGERKASEPWEDLVVKILLGEPLHPSLLALAAKMVAAGMSGAAVENFLRGLMEKSAAPRDRRWQERYDDIPRLVGSAEQFRPPPPIDTATLFAHLRGHNGPSPGAGAGTASGGAGAGTGSANAAGGNRHGGDAEAAMARYVELGPRADPGSQMGDPRLRAAQSGRAVLRRRRHGEEHRRDHEEHRPCRRQGVAWPAARARRRILSRRPRTRPTSCTSAWR